MGFRKCCAVGFTFSLDARLTGLTGLDWTGLTGTGLAHPTVNVIAEDKVC